MSNNQEEDDDWTRIWNARLEALQTVLGETDDQVFHATVPMFLGGQADVLRFPHHVSGATYVTSDLVGSEDQPPNNLGFNYELMMCTRKDSDWAVNLLCQLGPYTLETVINPRETMDIDSAVPEGSTISALLFCEPELKQPLPDVLGNKAMLLLCLGITKAELAQCRDGHTDTVLRRLRDSGIFPYTDLTRDSV